MRLYQRAKGGAYQLEIRLPDGRLLRQTTHEREERRARAVAVELQRAALRRWSKQEDLFESRDNYRFERAAEDFAAERMHAALALATIEIDGQHIKALTAATDGAGRPFFAGRLLREIDGALIADYVTQQKAVLGRSRGGHLLTVETIGKRLGTLRQILTSARRRRGEDGRPLLCEVPPIPNLGRSREPDGWGRALTRAEWESFRLALPAGYPRRGPPHLFQKATTMSAANRARLAAGVPLRGPNARTGGAERGPKMWHATLAGRTKSLGTADETEARARAALWAETVPGAPRAVDQRGWAEICLWTAQHTADVNEFTPEKYNLTNAPGPPPARLPPNSFLWTNSKNRHRTRGRVRTQIRRIPAELRSALERMIRERGERPGVPLAGAFGQGHVWIAMRRAARAAGLVEVPDERGRPHLVSPNDLRRTAATWLAEVLVVRGSGPDRSAIEVIAEFLGHRGLDVARRIYDRAAGTRLDVAADALDGLAAERKGPQRIVSDIEAARAVYERTRRAGG